MPAAERDAVLTEIDALTTAARREVRWHRREGD
jgi:hypothetical protein